MYKVNKCFVHYFFRGENLSIGYDTEDYIKREDIKLRLVGIGKCNKSMITFTKDKYTRERYDYWLGEFRSNKNIHKIIKIEDGIEEIILERE